jgi:hypothetical protein
MACHFSAWAQESSCDAASAKSVFDLSIINQRTNFKGNSIDLARALGRIVLENQQGFSRIQAQQNLAKGSAMDRTHSEASVDREVISLRLGLQKAVKALFGGAPFQFLSLALEPDVRIERERSIEGFGFRLAVEWEEGNLVWKKSFSHQVEVSLRFSEKDDYANVCFKNGGCHAILLSAPLNTRHCPSEFQGAELNP